MEYGERDEQPRSPYHHLYEVAPHGRVAHHGLHARLAILLFRLALLAEGQLVVERVQRHVVHIFCQEEEHQPERCQW